MSVLLLIFALSAKCIPFDRQSRYTLLSHLRIMYVNNEARQLLFYTNIYFFFGFSFFIICSVHYHSYSWPLLAYFFLLAFWLISICKPKKWACIVCCAQTFFVGGWFFVIFSNFWPKTIKYPLLRVSKRQLYCDFEQRAYFFS